MALLRIGGMNAGKRREELLSSYEGEEPYMPGGYETPYDGEEPYMPDGYGASDDGYEGDYDGYADDYGYDEPYGDGSRYDDDYGYGEAYGYEDEDWPEEDDGYGPAPYYGAPEYAGEREYPEGAAGGLMRYLDEHDWPTWLLLFLCPPVGVWLLWRRQRYNQAGSVALSVLSLMWLAVAVFVLVAKPFKPAGDTTITPQPVGAAAVAAIQESQEEAAEEEPTPTAIPPEAVDEANAVYTVAGKPYYHQSESCSVIPADAEVSRVARNGAMESGLLACPYCMAGQYSDGLWDLVFVDADTEDKSGMTVYCSPYNSKFHTNATCSDIGGDAQEVGLKDALLMAKKPCEVCCPQAAMQFYCTKDGTYYHAKDDCSGMRDASYVTYAEARVTGKKRCPVCIGGEDETLEPVSKEEAAASGYYVYATQGGTYYHVNSTCSGMKNAQQVLLSDMLKEGRPACPVCCPDAEATVYAESGNPYYHSYATCSGMTNATQGILVNALAAGLTKCPECWTTD